MYIKLVRSDYIYIYNSDGLTNSYGMRLKVSCLRNHQAYTWLLILIQ